MTPIAEPCYIFQGQPGKTSLCSCFGSSRPRETSGAAPYSARPWAYQTRLSSTAPRSRPSPLRDFTTSACIFFTECFVYVCAFVRCFFVALAVFVFAPPRGVFHAGGDSMFSRDIRGRDIFFASARRQVTDRAGKPRSWGCSGPSRPPHCMKLPIALPPRCEHRRNKLSPHVMTHQPTSRRSRIVLSPPSGTQRLI